jgi:LmbE family N-acetylglucosaminyl deacetylase
MKPSPRPDLPPLLAFGAHPDDIEFGCGGVIARETRAGRKAHFVVCSRGEAGTHGTPRRRTAEAKQGAQILGASIEFLHLDGDARLELKAAHARRLAAIIRRVRPGLVLAPTVEPNQHPDHWRLGQLVRDAARLARYGGLKGLPRPAHAISHLLFYAVSPGAEPAGATPVYVNVSDVLATWIEAMEAHASQGQTRNYAAVQCARAVVHGERSGGGYAIPLYPNDPLVFDSLAPLARAARRF